MVPTIVLLTASSHIVNTSCTNPSVHANVSNGGIEGHHGVAVSEPNRYTALAQETV